MCEKIMGNLISHHHAELLRAELQTRKTQLLLFIYIGSIDEIVQCRNFSTTHKFILSQGMRVYTQSSKRMGARRKASCQ